VGALPVCALPVGATPADALAPVPGGTITDGNFEASSAATSGEAKEKNTTPTSIHATTNE
jgi:hypothetical protein